MLYANLEKLAQKTLIAIILKKVVMCDFESKCSFFNNNKFMIAVTTYIEPVPMISEFMPTYFGKKKIEANIKIAPAAQLIKDFNSLPIEFKTQLVIWHTPIGTIIQQDKIKYVPAFVLLNKNSPSSFPKTKYIGKRTKLKTTEIVIALLI